MAWFHGTVTDYQDMLVKLIAMAVNDHVETVVVNAGGTGYVVGDILTVVGGTVEESLVGTIEVTSETGGVIDGVRVDNAGAYSADPTLTANAVTGGTGSGATMDLTMLASGWTTQRDVLSGSPSEREWIAKGTGSGSDEIFIGVRTYRNTGVGAFNWEVGGFTGFNGASAWEDQSGWSGNNIDSYVPLLNSGLEYWISVTPRRTYGVIKGGTGYSNLYMGFVNTFSTPNEYPYPLLIGGCTTDVDRVITNSNDWASGLIDPRSHSSAGNGPLAIRFTDGVWYSITNREQSATTKTDRNMFPIGYLTTAGGQVPGGVSAADNYYLKDLDFSWSRVTERSNSDPLNRLYAAEDSGGDLTHLIPSLILFKTPGFQIVGELDGVFWPNGSGNNLITEDTIIKDGERYFIFNNLQRSESWALVAIKQG